MPLNPIQVDNVGTCRKFLELLIHADNEFETFVAWFDAIQLGDNAFTIDATVLDDATGGAAPRTDAPEITGQNLQALRDIANNMKTQLDAQRNTLIAKMARDLKTVKQSSF